MAVNKSASIHLGFSEMEVNTSVNEIAQEQCSSLIIENERGEKTST